MASSEPQPSSQESAGGRSTGSNRGTLEARVTGSKVEVSSNDWSESIRENLLLVDKSFILPEVVDNKGPILLTRPRRFGKTMCLSMFEDFFGIPRGETLEEKKARYMKLEIGTDPEFIDAKCGRYPVIRLDLKAKNLLWSFPEIRGEVDASKERLPRLKALLKEEWARIKTNITSCTGILELLVQFLNIYYDRKCILLIDEFDTPIINASEDNRDTIRKHIREVLAPVVKALIRKELMLPGLGFSLSQSGTADIMLSKCIMVSVNPVSLSEVYSGLNNARTLPLHYASQESYTDNPLELKDMIYQIAFGFTEDEVRKLIATRVFPGNEAMVEVALDVARDWYDGYYVFKNFRIYNPWSVMNFIQSLTRGKPCSNKAEVLAKALPYWIATGSDDILKKMYGKITKINPSISHVIVRMYLDYFNLKNRDTTEPSDSPPQTSIRVELVDSLTEEHLTQVEKPCFDERTKHIEVVIASSNRDAMIKNPTLDKFMTMAYYYGYLTIIGGKYLAIPNREMLSFWAPLVSARVSVPCELFMVQQSRMLMQSLVSENRGGFCDAIKRNFLDHLIKADARAQEYYYHEM
ncbi:hypothetical protein EV182_003728, partial [Spiromyces aspiralis]